LSSGGGAVGFAFGGEGGGAVGPFVSLYGEENIV